MKIYIQKLLKTYSIKIVKKYKPQIIGITGSIGKTSTREAIFAVLNKDYAVRAARKNYNNEIGVPLTIIGIDESPGGSLWGWIKVLARAWRLTVFHDKNYPRILILEMGVDHPGDMKYLLEIVQPDIGVLTNIGPSHLENFDTLEKLIREKKQIVTKLKKDNYAIINSDNEYINSITKSIKATILTYGFNESAAVRALELEQRGHGMDVDGMQFKLMYEGSAVPVFLPGAVGQNAIMASLAAVSIGVALGMNLLDVVERLRTVQWPAGRMRLLKGIKNTLLIDDTYNASPESTIKALEALSKFHLTEGTRKIAVLGSMLELGSFTEQGHLDVGVEVVKQGIDILITVGDLGAIIGQGAQKAGLKEEYIFNFDYSPEAGRFLQDRMKQGDLILIKGSQGARMEKIVKEVMAEPERASQLLVRQGHGWDV